MRIIRRYLPALYLLLGMILTLGACASGAPAETESLTETESETEWQTQTETETDKETDMETEKITETETEMSVPVAGENSEHYRDGFPKKYITVSFDDGITQDARIIELFKKHGLDNCTFFVNTGLGGANWEWVGQQFHRPDVTHIRYTIEEMKTGIYDGFDLEGHTLTHPSLKNFAIRTVIDEVQKDADNIQEITGIKPIGFSWPGGDTEWNEKNVEWIYQHTDIRFGRAAASTYNFDLPEYFLTWYPTCNFSETLHGGAASGLLDEFISAECEEDMLFYVWCHGYELDLYGSWDAFDAMLAKIAKAAAEDEEIVLVTNAEFYQLFKDEIPAWKD